jgi:hypothetical protein
MAPEDRSLGPRLFGEGGEHCASIPMPPATMPSKLPIRRDTDQVADPASEQKQSAEAHEVGVLDLDPS